MRQFITYLVIATIMGSITISCERDESLPQVMETKKEEVAPLKDFVLEKKEVVVKKGSTEKIKIISGNGEYDYTQNLGIATLNISGDKQYVEITALQDGGTIKTDIIDEKSGKRIEITIHTTK